MLTAVAVAAEPNDPDALALAELLPWLNAAVDAAGIEHAVLSDGRHHVRIDVENGSLLSGTPVVLHYRIGGIVSAESKILPLRRLIWLVRNRRFGKALVVRDPRLKRHVLALRVSDALAAGATNREIAEELWDAGTASFEVRESLRLRIHRLVAETARLRGGAWRMLMRRPRV
ncbi:DNA -binding domain-containing protein [Novosphingobium sp. Gsoil 351]|uniref:DNA -binding domain-containing protein n=1 Tax=Novosphingobium sp. Gsoil 351 TaxID=2675225 RepID=UPI0018A84F80|nr:DUF2285 domain-containing protein [Novosphingobium sp. Gsoil 351]